MLSICSQNPVIPLNTYLVLVNSRLMTFYHRNKFLDEFKMRFQKILIKDCRRFPIRLPDPTNPTDKARHDEIVAKVGAMLDAKKQLAKVDDGQGKRPFTKTSALLSTVKSTTSYMKCTDCQSKRFRSSRDRNEKTLDLWPQKARFLHSHVCIVEGAVRLHLPSVSCSRGSSASLKIGRQHI